MANDAIAAALPKPGKSQVDFRGDRQKGSPADRFLDVSDPALLASFGDLLFEASRDLPAAKRAFSRAASDVTAPPHVKSRALGGLARLAQVAGDRRQAESLYSHSFRADPDNALSALGLGEVMAASLPPPSVGPPFGNWAPNQDATADEESSREDEETAVDVVSVKPGDLADAPEDALPSWSDPDKEVDQWVRLSIRSVR